MMLGNIKWKKDVVPFQGYVHLNPLMWTESDFDGRGATASFGNLFKFLSGGIGDKNGLKYAQTRYKKIQTFSIFPAEISEFNIIVILLKGSVTNYIIRNPIGVIASCGMIGEIMGNFLFEVWNNLLQKHSLNEKGQTRLFGQPVKDLFQKRRIGILFELGIIDSSTKSYFDKIREIRNTYLHPSGDLANAENDAEIIFENVNKMLEHTLQIKIDDKKIWINTQIADYLINLSKVDSKK